MEELASIRCAVVTGGNKGMGLEICRQLASAGVLVILTSRDEKRGVEAVQKLKDSGLSNVVYHQLDLKDELSISSLADFIGTHFKKLDILLKNNEPDVNRTRNLLIWSQTRYHCATDPFYVPILSGSRNFFKVNNAADPGLQIDGEAFRALPNGFGDVKDEDPDIVKRIMEQTYEKADDGLKTNYYGTKAVTEALLPFLKLSTSANIVNVSSAYGNLKYIYNEKVKSELNNVQDLTEERLDEILKMFLKDFKAEKLQENGWPITLSAYKVSKVALNAYTRMLANRFPNMRINCVHPGYVKTDITANTGLLTAEEGAQAIVKLALLPEDGPSGQYFYEMKLSTF